MRISARLPSRSIMGYALAQQKAKQHRHQNASGENIQRWIRLGGDHPVINLHGKTIPASDRTLIRKAAIMTGR